MSRADVGPAEPSDAELLERLRSGDISAYDLLWSRYVGAALRYARRLAPLEPEDLVAEAFTNVFHQIVDAGSGPRTSFGGYLFTSIRNTASRWQQDAHRVALIADIEAITPPVEASSLDEVENHAALLRAFRTMPERWQRVLWLTGVEEVSRTEVARHMNLKPNAVSALQRRARAGLRERLLHEHLPASLRSDDDHVARLLPAVLLGRASLPRAASSHLEECEICQEVRRQLREVARRTTRVSLTAMGFGALGVALRSVSQGVSGPVAAAVASLSAGSATTVIVGTGVSATTLLKAAAAAVGGLLVLVDIALPQSGVVELPAADAVMATAPPQEVAPVPAAPDTTTTPKPAASPSPPAAHDDGDDADHPFVDFSRSDASGSTPRPAPIPPLPVAPGTLPPPSTDPDALRAPTMTSAEDSGGYLAPVLSGTAIDGARVALQVDDDVYEIEPDAEGAWSFDLSDLALPYGDHLARAWQHSDTSTSAATETSFTVNAPVLDGFLLLGSLDAALAKDTGIVFTVAGPAGGVACLRADTGQSVQIPLDASGSAARRVRFLTAGPYVLDVAICDAERHGPATTSPIDIQNGGFGVFGDLVEREIEVSAP